MTRKRRIVWEDVDVEISKDTKKEFVRDDGYSENLFDVKANLDEKGCYQGIIRFLPRPENDGSGVPYVRLYNHGFKQLQWFIENCPTTHKNPCPVCESNKENWETDEETSRKRGRRTSYYSNILIVSDPKHPENEGKVFIFRYGKTIQDMILEKIQPEEGSLDEKIRVHDYDKGLNFKLKIKPKKGYNDYSSSQFSDTITPIADTDEEIDSIDDRLFPLSQIVSDDKFKSYDELKNRFNATIGESTIEIEKDEPKPEQKFTNSDDVSDFDDDSELEENLDDPDKFFEDLNKTK